MSKKEQSKNLHFAHIIRPHHGNTFAEEFVRIALETEAGGEAFGETHVIEWPESAELKPLTPAQERYCELEKEIIRRTFDLLKQPMTEAFVKAATEVVNRERDKY